MGFQGVAVSPVNPDSMTPLLDRVAAKMPVICHDSDAPKSKRSAYVGTNNVEAGRAAGAAALKALGDKRKGKVAIFVGRIDMQNAIERRQGVEEALKGTGLEILPVFLDGTDRTKAKKNVEDALARYPDLVLAIGLWSYNGPTHGGRGPRVVAQGEAGDRRLRRGRGDAEGGRGRARLRDHRAEAVRVRLSVDEAAQGHQGRQAGSHHRQPRHQHHHQGKPDRVLDQAQRAAKRT